MTKPVCGVTGCKRISQLPYFTSCHPVTHRPCMLTPPTVSDMSEGVRLYILQFPLNVSRTRQHLRSLTSTIGIPGCTSDINRPVYDLPLNSNQRRHLAQLIKPAERWGRGENITLSIHVFLNGSQLGAVRKKKISFVYLLMLWLNAAEITFSRRLVNYYVL